MKSVVFIESNFTGIDAIMKASRAGHKCYLVTSDFEKLKSMLPHDIFEAFGGTCQVINVKNSDDVEEVLATVRNLPQPLSAVMTFSQFRLVTASKVAKSLGLRFTDPSAIATAIDKFELRETMRLAGQPSIRYLALSSTCDPKKIVSEVGLPCILKPSRGHSSLGIQLLKTEQEILNAIVTHSSANSREELIFEEYLDGPFFSLETITTAPGQHFAWGYTDRALTQDFIEMGGTFPADVPDEQSGIDLVFGALDAIGFNFGNCHTEMIFTKQGPRIVEINPRPGGSGVCRLVERASQTDVVLETVEMFLGQNISESLSYSKTVTMRSILPETSGVITELPRKSEILQLPGVKDVWFQRREGDLTDDTRSNFSVILTVLAEAANGRSSVENADAAALWCAKRVKVVPVFERVETSNAG